MNKLIDFKLANNLVSKLNEYALQIFSQKPELILDVASSSHNYCEECTNSYQVHNTFSYCQSCTNCYASNSPVE